MTTDPVREILSALLGAYVDKFSPVELNRLVASLPPEQQGMIYNLVKKYPGDVDLSALIQQDTMTGDDRFRIWTAKDALAERPKTKDLVEGLIKQGTVNLLVGDSGSKKTYIALWLAACVYLAGKFLDFQCEQGSVLYVDEETSVEFLLDRLAEVIKGAGADDTLQVDVISGAAVNLRNDNDLFILETLIQTKGYRLLILDAMADFMPGADENTSKDITPFFLALRRIAKDTGCSVVLLHHTAKMTGLYRGSTDIKSKVDLMLMVESKPEDSTVNFRTEKQRHGKPLTFSAEATWIDGAFYLEKAEIESTAFLSKGENYVLRFLKEYGAKAKSTIVSSADSCSERQASDAIYSLANKGLIYRTNPGVTGRGNEAVYDVKQAE